MIRYIGVQDRADRALFDALDGAAKAAESRVRELRAKTGVGATVRKAQLNQSLQSIHKVTVTLFNRANKIIKSGQIEAQDEAIDAMVEWEKDLLERIEPDPVRRELLIKAMHQAADRDIQAMVSRILHTKQDLSTRVYKTRQLANGYIDKMINDSLAHGDSPDDLARKVRDFIRPDVPGGVSYAAKRLARTEINNAFHAQSIQSAMNAPWINEMEWHLSKTHKPKPGEQCERFARKGTFPITGVPPKPHPQCMCYVAPKLIPWKQFLKGLNAGKYDEWIAEPA